VNVWVIHLRENRLRQREIIVLVGYTVLFCYLNQQNVKATIIIIMGRSTWKVPLEMTITEEVLRQSTE